MWILNIDTFPKIEKKNKNEFIDQLGPFKLKETTSTLLLIKFLIGISSGSKVNNDGLLST